MSRKKFKEEHSVQPCVDNQFPSSVLSFLRHMIYDSHQKRFSYQLGNTKEYHRCYTGGAEPVLTYYCVLYHSGGESLDHFMTVPLFFCLCYCYQNENKTHLYQFHTNETKNVCNIHNNRNNTLFFGVDIIVQVDNDFKKRFTFELRSGTHILILTCCTGGCLTCVTRCGFY